MHKCTNRYPDTPQIVDENRQSVDGLDRAAVFVNAEGARIDTFRVRDTAAHGGVLFLMGQQKRFNCTVLALDGVQEEVAKAESAASDLKSLLLPAHQLLFRYQLVIFAATAEETLLKPPEIFPENCVLLCGSALREYFGAVISDRAFVALSFVPVRINFVMPDSLLTVPGIGAETLKRIIDSRMSDGPFVNWDDLRDRVGGVYRSVAKYLSFDL